MENMGLPINFEVLSYNVQWHIKLESTQELVTKQRSLAPSATVIEWVLQSAHNVVMLQLWRNDAGDVGRNVLGNVFSTRPPVRHSNILFFG
jgi:hypothetical protein